MKHHRLAPRWRLAITLTLAAAACADPARERDADATTPAAETAQPDVGAETTPSDATADDTAEVTPEVTPDGTGPTTFALGLDIPALHIPVGELGAMSFDDWLAQTQARLAAGSHTIATPEGDVEYAFLGAEAGPTVLILHGTPGGYDFGHVMARAFAQPGVRYLTVSRPGYLRTPLGAANQTPAAQATQLLHALDALGVERVFVWAVSGGGPTALALAKAAPTRLQGLIMESTVSEALFAGSASPVGDETMFAMLQNPAAAVGQFVGADEAALIAADAGFLSSAQAFLQTMLPLAERTAGWSNDVDQIKVFASALDGPLPFPVLIVHGTIDENVPLAHATGLAERLEVAGTEVESLTIEGAGHALFITHADVFGQAVARFVAGHR